MALIDELPPITLPRVVDAAPGQPRVGLGGEAPVGAGIGDRVEVAHRHLDPEPVVVAAGLDHQHPVVGVGAETIGQQAARAARAHDDEVELGDRTHAGIVPPLPRVHVPVCADLRRR